MRGVPRQSVARGHSDLLSRGILTKSMHSTFYKCGVSFGLRHGMITGKAERTPPGFAVAVGLTMQDLLQVWAQRTIDGKPLPVEEARQLLSEKYDSRLRIVPADDPDLAKAPPKDEKVGKLLALYEEWLRRYESVSENTGPVRYVERQYGFDGSTKIGGIPVAGTVDLETTLSVLDNKTVGSRSRYRKRQVRTPTELVIYSRLTGKSASGYLVFVHDLKTKAPVEYLQYIPTKDDEEIVAGQLQAMWDALRRGVFLPPEGVAAGPNAFPCSPRWCGYFGRQCPITKHLRREDYQ